MATLAKLQTRREALAASRSSGVARVSYDGKTVEYRSLDEIDRAIDVLDREICHARGPQGDPAGARDHEQGIVMGLFDAFRRRVTGGPSGVRARLEGAMSRRRLRGWQPPLENINSLVASGRAASVGALARACRYQWVCGQCL